METEINNVRAEIEARMNRKKELIERLNRIARDIDRIADKLYNPSDYTGSEYNNLYDKYKELDILYSNLENQIKIEFPHKDMPQTLEEIRQNNNLLNI